MVGFHWADGKSTYDEDSSMNYEVSKDEKVAELRCDSFIEYLMRRK